MTATMVEHRHAAPGGGHDKHEGHTPGMFRDRLWVSLVLTVPILYFSEQFQDWFGYRAVSFPGRGVLVPVLATVLYVYAGAVFLQGGLRELRGRVPGMMTLISIAISVAYFYSLAVSSRSPTESAVAPRQRSQNCGRWGSHR